MGPFEEARVDEPNTPTNTPYTDSFTIEDTFQNYKMDYQDGGVDNGSSSFYKRNRIFKQEFHSHPPLQHQMNSSSNFGPNQGRRLKLQICLPQILLTVAK